MMMATKAVPALTEPYVSLLISLAVHSIHRSCFLCTRQSSSSLLLHQQRTTKQVNAGIEDERLSTLERAHEIAWLRPQSHRCTTAHLIQRRQMHHRHLHIQIWITISLTNRFFLCLPCEAQPESSALVFPFPSSISGWGGGGGEIIHILCKSRPRGSHSYNYVNTIKRSDIRTG